MKSYKISAILWLFVSLIWVGLTIGKIIDGDSVWIIALNALVAILSAVNTVLNFLKYRKNK